MTIQVGYLSWFVSTLAVGEILSRVSSTIRTGERSSKPGSLQVRSGSSASTVPDPTMMAS